jgi:putative SOS response-associated peptidase YedK
MCGAFTEYSETGQLVQRFRVPPDLLTEIPKRYKIKPMSQVGVVRQEGDGRRSLSLMQWSLVPFWAKGPKLAGYAMFNAKVEGIESKPAWREPFKRRRCIIPATGLIEWRHVGAEYGKKWDRAFPMHFTATDGRPLAFAGLWDHWKAKDPSAVPEGEPTELTSCTIVVFEPTDIVRGVHGRMPVVLPEEAWDAWLDPATDLAEVRSLLRVYPGLDQMTELNTAVNGTGPDGAHCLLPPAPGESADDYAAWLASPEGQAEIAASKARQRKPKANATEATGTGLVSDMAPKPTRTRKPRARKGSTPDIDLFTTN